MLDAAAPLPLPTAAVARAPARRRSAGVSTAVLTAVLLLLAGVTGLAALAQAREGGAFTTPAAHLATTTAALVTDEVDVGAGRPGDPSPDAGDVARVRLRATADDAGTAIFVGIGPRDAVAAYLRATAHEEVAGFALDPLRVDLARRPGAPSAARPGDQGFWVASAAGTGTRSLEWDKRRGAWSAVVMRADGLPGLSARVDLGLRFGFLAPVALALGASAACCALVTLRRWGAGPVSAGGSAPRSTCGRGGSAGRRRARWPSRPRR